jgi:hypothetical protein
MHLTDAETEISPSGKYGMLCKMAFAIRTLLEQSSVAFDMPTYLLDAPMTPICWGWLD